MRGMLVALGILIGASPNAQTPSAGCQNIDCVLAAVPMPSLTVPEVLAVARQRMPAATNYTLVGIEWCKASAFKPRFSDGTAYSPANDQPDEYSWFLTYVYPDPRRPADKAVFILRIKADGSAGLFIGTRT